MSAEDEYKNLKNYFEGLVKKTMWFVGLITTLGSIIFLVDRSNLQDRLTRMEIDYKEAIGRVEEKAEIEVSSVKVQVEGEIASDIRNEVTLQLNRKNINEIIDNQLDILLSKNFSYELKAKLKEAIEKDNESLNELVEISDAALFMRLGFKRGLTELKDYSLNGRFSRNRVRALELLNKITKDYEEIHSNMSNSDLQQMACYVISNGDEIEDYIKVINEEEFNLNKISATILLLNRKAKTAFKLFEFDRINEWNNKRKR